MFILVMICIWTLGFYKLEALGVLMGSIDFFTLVLWLSYCALLIVCLVQALSYIIRMRKCSMTFSWESGSEFYM